MNFVDYEKDPIDNMTFTNDRCFLCGKELNDENKTVEHVYPKWLQNKFDLWNQELILLNGTMIKYRQLTIPCCKNCNSIMSSEIEKPMENAVSGGYEEFIKLDKKNIFQWLNKLSYGMLYKELSLKADIKEPLSESIYSEKNLRKHYMQHIFLKTIIDKSEFIHQPWSILIFKIKPSNEQDLYWAHDNPIFKTFFIRMNDIGIISNLMDNGYQEEFYKNFSERRSLLQKEMIPIQFAELCAEFFYKTMLFKRDPFFMTVYNIKEQKLKNIISQDISGEAFNDWNNECFAHILAFYWQDWGYTFDDIYEKNGGLLSSLRKVDGTFKV